MPRGGKCDHRKCGYDNCKALTDEELTPKPEDLEFAKKLIEEGYHSVSTKYCRVAKWAIPRPTGQEILKPEFLDTVFGRDLARLWDDRKTWGLRMDHKWVTTLTLTLKQFRAFKMLGGPMA